MSVTTASGASSKMATITCNCGKVKLTLPNAVPKFRCGCYCTECLQRSYIETNGKLPKSKSNVWTKDWPEEKFKALALKEKSTRGEALPQIFDVTTALEEKLITDLVSALQIEALAKPENSISYAELLDAMEVKIEKAFFHESRAHLPDKKP